MYELKSSTLATINGGHCQHDGGENRELLTTGGYAGAALGLAMAAYYRAPLHAMPFFALRGHLLGMMVQAGIKFTRFYADKKRTGDPTINPFVDAFCK